MNKYNIGQEVEYKCATGIQRGAIYGIQIATIRRYQSKKNGSTRSFINPNSVIGYKLTAYDAKNSGGIVIETNILKVIN